MCPVYKHDRHPDSPGSGLTWSFLATQVKKKVDAVFYQYKISLFHVYSSLRLTIHSTIRHCTLRGTGIVGSNLYSDQAGPSGGPVFSVLDTFLRNVHTGCVAHQASHSMTTAFFPEAKAAGA